MVDPLSMTSLGITICQGLLFAYGAWKDFDTDIAKTCRAVEDLTRTLKVLQTYWTSSLLVEADLVFVQECIEGCNAGLQSLNETLNSIKGAHIPAGPKHKAWLKLQHTIYPFRKDAMTKLQGTVANLESRLDFALQVYQTKTLDRLNLEVQAISKIVHRTAVKSPEALGDMRRQSDDTRGAGSPVVLPQEISSADLVPKRVEQVLLQRLGMVSQGFNPVFVLIRSIVGLQDDKDIGQALVQLISKPALHREVLRAMRSHRGSGFAHSPAGPNSSSTLNRKYCGRGTAQQSQSLRDIRSCVKLLRAYLAISIEVSLKLLRGAGGAAISTFLTVRGVVYDDSPAFDLLHSAIPGWPLQRPEKYTVEATGAIMNGIVQKLEILFREGNASPTDVDSYGNSLLHVAVSKTFYPLGVQTAAYQQYEDIFFDFLSALIRLGVPMNETTKNDRTILDSVGWGSFEYAFERDLRNLTYYSRLLQLGAEPSGKAIIDESHEEDSLVVCRWHFPGRTTERKTATPFSIVSALARDEDTAEASSCGILSHAVLSQSEAALELALREFPRNVWERNILGQSPLHLAVGWPQGIARLLQAGADINAMDNHSLTPLLYACSAKCLKTVQQLLAGGSAFRSHIDQGHSRSVRLALQFALTGAADCVDLVDVLIEGLSSRRKQLLELAIEILPAETMNNLHIAEDRTLDERTSDVYDALKHDGIVMPVALYSHSREVGTVFNMNRLTCEVADRLYDAGFRDIEGYNADGLTPLMALGFAYLFGDPHPHLFFWFVSKGASLLTFHRNRNWRALHYVAAQFGALCASHWVNDVHELSNGLAPHINGIMYAVKQSGGATLVARQSDYCSCACSSTGCTMTVSDLKAFSLSIRRFTLGGTSTWTHESRLEYVDLWLSLLEVEPTSVADIIIEILRLVIFEELNLTHTCCWFDNDTKHRTMWHCTTIEDRLMIQEEEAETIQHLENLMGLAIFRAGHFAGSLSEFLKQFLFDEINYYPENWDEDYVREVEDLGVKLDRASVD